ASRLAEAGVVVNVAEGLGPFLHRPSVGLLWEGRRGWAGDCRSRGSQQVLLGVVEAPERDAAPVPGRLGQAHVVGDDGKPARVGVLADKFLDEVVRGVGDRVNDARRARVVSRLARGGLAIEDNRGCGAVNLARLRCQPAAGGIKGGNSAVW